MPFNSSNVFQRLYSWVVDRDNSVLILAERMDSDTDDIVAGINRIMSGEADFIGPLKGVNGTASAPAYSFTDDPDSGFYRAAGNTVGVSTGGVKKVEIAGLETRFFNNLVVNAGTITNIQLNNSTTSQSSFPTPDASVGAPPKIEGSYEDGYVGIVLHPKQTVNYDLAITLKEGEEGGPQWWADAIEYKIWTENNDGAGSGLDADLLDGKQASEFTQLSGGGILSVPNTPAFHATGGANLETGEWVLVAPSNAVLNNGSHYNTANGRFTAPESGFHFFGYRGLLFPADAIVKIAFRKNGLNLEQPIDEGGSTFNHVTASGMQLIHLNEGDYVDLAIYRLSGNVNAYSIQWNFFGTKIA